LLDSLSRVPEDPHGAVCPYRGASFCCQLNDFIKFFFTSEGYRGSNKA